MRTKTAVAIWGVRSVYDRSAVAKLHAKTLYGGSCLMELKPLLHRDDITDDFSSVGRTRKTLPIVVSDIHWH